MAQHVLGIFETQEAARTAVDAISRFVPRDRVSLVTKADQIPDYAEKTYETDNIVDGTMIGAALGTVVGLTTGFATAMYPGAGNLLVSIGPLAAGMYGAWSGGMLGGLIDLGISSPNAQEIHQAVENGKILLAAEVQPENHQLVEQLFIDYGGESVVTR